MSTNYTDTTVPTTSYTKEGDPSIIEYDPQGHDLILVDTAGNLVEDPGDYYIAANNF